MKPVTEVARCELDRAAATGLRASRLNLNTFVYEIV